MDLREVTLTNINCYSCTLPVFQIKTKALTLGSATSITYSGINDDAYSNNLKAVAPFF